MPNSTAFSISFVPPIHWSVSIDDHAVDADGVAFALVTITVTDANNHPVASRTVTITSPSATAVVSLGTGAQFASGLTDGNGQIAFHISDSAAEAVSFTATLT